MIIVLEPVCVGEEHVQFNASLLSIAGMIAHDGRVVFWSQDKHQAFVRRQRASLEENCSVEYNSLEIPPRHLQSIRRRLPLDIKILNRIFSEQAIEDIELVIICCVTESMLLAAKVKFSLSAASVPIVLIFHSILPRFLVSRKRRLMLSFATPSQMKYVVLGEHIVRNLNKNFPSLSGKFSAIEHPYHFPGQVYTPKSGSVTSFGFIGLGNTHKGFPSFLKLVQAIGQQCAERRSFCFSFIGRVAPDCADVFRDFLGGSFAGLLGVSSNEVMPRVEFEAAISKLDYIVMPYDDEFYQYVCSGSSLDSLSYLKPIVAIKGSFFDSLFSVAGDIGYLCENMDEMIDVVLDLIVSPDPTRWENQCRNLLAARRHYLPSTIAVSLARIGVGTQS